MKNFLFKLHHTQLLADTITPVSVYLKLRDQYPNSILLESSDYHANDNSFSYLCFNPLASFKVDKQSIETIFPDGERFQKPIVENHQVINDLQSFMDCFNHQPNPYKCISSGLFGYTTYDAVQYFEKVEIAQKSVDNQIPLMYYALYKNIIAINHFKNEAYIFCLSTNEENNISEIEQLLSTKNFASFPFQKKHKYLLDLNRLTPVFQPLHPLPPGT